MRERDSRISRNFVAGKLPRRWGTKQGVKSACATSEVTSLVTGLEHFLKLFYHPLPFSNLPLPL